MGGIERIIHYLTEGLIKRGHKVTLFASGDSKTIAKLISVTKKALANQTNIKGNIEWIGYIWNTFNTSRAFEMANQFDIIHTHWAWSPFFFIKFTSTPCLHTFHNTPRGPILEYYKSDINAIFISKSEKKNCKIHFKRSWVIYHGVDLSQFKFNSKGGDHFVWIGRISFYPKKGLENAILAVKKLNAKLFFAGPIFNKNYFEEKIKPYLSSKIKYLGEIPQKELSKFYGEAKCLLYPIEWEEPFGLVMAEALACGTPVIVFNRGSAKEIVENGKTGFVVKDFKELIEAMKKVEQIPRINCRKRAEKFFSHEKMVENYEKVYYQILK